MNDFVKDMIARIERDGDIPVAQFMGEAVSHYYAHKIPFGIGGDFITAPEISQMFGELIGLWCVDCWVRLGKPQKLHLIECGAGRGTMMADMLRATKALPAFHEALSVHLVENSMQLMVQQKQALEGYEVMWHEGLEQIALDAPFILLGNEFLDALPIEQYEYKDGGWHKRLVGASEGRLAFSTAEDVLPISHYGRNGDVIELSSARDAFVAMVAEKLAAHKGVALFIDYGHEKSAVGDTLQAVKAHQFVDVLSFAGEADITSHVDFESISQEAQEKGCSVYGPAGQGVFLKALGIEQRAEVLAKNAAPLQREDIATALARLTSAKEMGALFKVMAIFAPQALNPSGF